MATYAELYDLSNDPSSQPLRQKVTTAITIKSQTILDDGAATATAKLWARDALEEPSSVLDQLFNYVLAANKDQSTSTILGATDSQIQTNVDAAIDSITGAI